MQTRLRGMVNHKMPPFPCNVLAYSKDENIRGFKVLRFNDQASFDHFRTNTVAMVRVLLTEDDLNDLSDDKLRMIYNTLRQEDELGASEIPRNELQGLTFGVIHNPDAATPYEETKMGTATAPETGTATPATPAVDAATKAEAKAADAKAKRDAKEAEKNKKKQDAAARRADGVIGTIRKALDTEKGTTANEVLNTLVAKFPDRTREGMSSTVKIQFSRLEKSTGRDIINAKIVGRGRVYKFADKGIVPGVVETDTPTPAAAPTAGAPAPVAAPTGVATPATEPEVPAPAAAPTATAAPAKKGGVKK